jgi:hypothetical protein
MTNDLVDGIVPADILHDNMTLTARIEEPCRVKPPGTLEYGLAFEQSVWQLSDQTDTNGQTVR